MKKKFCWRAFISLGLFITLLMMLVSGVILYISPPGRVANWTDWRMIGLTKRGWQNQHTIFGFAFLLLSLFHLFFINWKAFLCYLKLKSSEGFKRPAELVAITVIAVIFAIGTHVDMPPFSAIIKFGDSRANSWERREKQAPVPHAELMTLIQLAEQPGLGGDPDSLVKKLEKAGLKVASKNQTLADIATMNGKSAEEVYAAVAPAETGSHRLQGGGFGKKTLQEIADEAGVSATSLQLALRQKGIDAEIDSPLKSIAERNTIEMNELRKTVETMISR
ncbi:DUF4405 domain-containing protein [Chlorobium sp. BLA1]|uniref:DUF4405 domain-containing protein n=1 Tax=Candidatus Chlorobium masyuteum TaxID=2716876 RepID=UPI001422DCDC|nr:DUF4405 domain-containing protein [Candidatus Chlorobium masyuteum]NHQ60415.1 DUF4405 domain-containing protein [Candidatus Chlorobium masyuteum]NTU44010.1 DUF4405 domain-containing protein [Chlorobiaceae bacterium]